MRPLTRGWRSARAYPAQATLAAAPSAASSLTTAPAPASVPAAFAWPWQNVKWNLAFIGFCVYSLTVITYVAPLGQISMIVALVGLLFSKERLKLPWPLLCFAGYYIYAALTGPGTPYYIVVKDELPIIGRIGLIFLVAMNVLTERTRLRFYIFLSLAAYGLYPVRGAIFNQFIYHAAELGRIAWNGSFANPNDLAALLIGGPLGLAAGVLFTERHKYVRYAALAGIGAISLIVFMTQSRGGILALGFFGAWAFARMKQRARMLPAIFAVAALVMIFAPSDVWDRLKSLGTATSSGELKDANDQGSAEQRMEIWKVAMAITRDYPFTGVGLSAYPYAHARYAIKTGEGFKRTARGLRDAHSSYLTALAETGIPGFLFWISIFLTAFFTAQRARRVIRQTDPDTERQIFFAQVAMMALGVAAIFGSYTNVPYTYVNVAILHGMSVVALDEHRRRYQVARR